MRRAAALGVLVPAVVVAALLSGCDSGSSSDSSSAAATGRPSVGTCHVYDAATVQEPIESSAPVSCTVPHTAETFAVVDGLPAPGADGTWDDQTLSQAGSVPCGTPALAKKLGATEADLGSTRIEVAFFGPNPTQANAGARWLRCDAVVFAANNPTLVTGVLSDLAKVTGAFAQCSRQLPVQPYAAAACGSGSGAGTRAAVGTVYLAAAGDPSSTATDPRVPDAAALRAACQRSLSGSVVSGVTASWATTVPTAEAQSKVRPFALCWLPFAQWNVDAGTWPKESPLKPVVGA